MSGLRGNFNDSAVKVPGEPALVKIARELVEIVKKNVTIDWTMRENVQAKVLSEVWAIG